MVFAKTSKAASRLSNQIRENTFHKTYIAVITGTLPNQGKLEDYLIKNNKTNISNVTTKEKGKYSALKYKVLKTKDNLSLIEINLITGRPHQIRVQFSSRNHPLLGDSKYGKNPTMFAAQAYDAANMVIKALKDGATDRKSLRDKLAGIKDFAGVTGVTSFDENRNVKKEISKLVIKDGKYTQFTNWEQKAERV